MQSQLDKIGELMQKFFFFEMKNVNERKWTFQEENILFQMLICKQMVYCCDICDKTFKFKSKIKHFWNLTHNKLEKCIRIKHSV